MVERYDDPTFTELPEMWPTPTWFFEPVPESPLLTPTALAEADREERSQLRLERACDRIYEYLERQYVTWLTEWRINDMKAKGIEQDWLGSGRLWKKEHRLKAAMDCWRLHLWREELETLWEMVRAADTRG